eukprot:XP_011669823.1 PREDICTED: alpha-(1,6)-fucosyltransferase-like [Strongylocentrotus purpuratus]
MGKSDGDRDVVNDLLSHSDAYDRRRRQSTLLVLGGLPRVRSNRAFAVEGFRSQSRARSKSAEDWSVARIHVRRTDKLIKEAKFHGIEEYMSHVEKYYQELEKRKEVSIRRVFLATDEVGLLYEARKKYPGYVFVSDNNISQSASVSLRLSEESLMGIILDLHLLARSDFLVCTCSSNICRLAYEMMQRFNLDASKKLHCVDRRYYWHGENTKHKTAKMPVYEGAENVHLMYGV